MEDKIKDLASDVTDLVRELQSFKREFADVKRSVTEIHNDMGVRSGQDMSRSIDEMLRNQKSILEFVKDTARRAQEINSIAIKLSQNNQEIMKALSLIYRSVDELEPELVGEHKS